MYSVSKFTSSPWPGNPNASPGEVGVILNKSTLPGSSLNSSIISSLSFILSINSVNYQHKKNLISVVPTGILEHAINDSPSGLVHPNTQWSNYGISVNGSRLVASSLVICNQHQLFLRFSFCQISSISWFFLQKRKCIEVTTLHMGTGIAVDKRLHIFSKNPVCYVYVIPLIFCFLLWLKYSL